MEPRVVLKQIGEGSRDASVSVGVYKSCSWDSRYLQPILQQHWRRASIQSLPLLTA